MLHPDIIKTKSPLDGFGLFAKKDIPKGTIIWKLGNIRIYTVDQYNDLTERKKDILRHFCYEGKDGTLVYCTDDSKYFNHSCDPNTMSLNDEIDITIKDVHNGEELTYDYGYWYIKWNVPFECKCGSENCRGLIKRESSKSDVIIRLESLANDAGKNMVNVMQVL